MKNIEKYQSLLETGEVDALLLTSAPPLSEECCSPFP